MYLNLPILDLGLESLQHEDTGYPIQFGRPLFFPRNKLRQILPRFDIATGQSGASFSV
jgi:hypothetical protein